ncbi:MAG: hypothetical protein AB7M05_18430 [Alphaproteobacteria bacterium]
MSMRLLACAMAFAALGSVSVLAAAESHADWQFSERPTQDGEKKLIAASAAAAIGGEPASLTIACVGGKPAVTLQAPADWTVQRFQFRFDEAQVRNIVDEVQTRDTVMVVRGRSARSFIRGASQAKSVLVTYAARPESQGVRYDLSGFQAGAADLLAACKDALL